MPFISLLRLFCSIISIAKECDFESNDYFCKRPAKPYKATTTDLYELCTLMRSVSVIAFVFVLPHAVAVFHAPLVVAFFRSQHFALAI